MLGAALLAFAKWPGALGGSGKSSAAPDVNFADIRVGKVSPGSGHIGVDIWWPGNGSAYLPCQNSNDVYYGACVLSNAATVSYYKVHHFTSSSSDFPYGIFVDNTNTNYCKTSSWCTNKPANSFTHGWARLISDASIEIYPYDSMGSYNPSGNTVGGVRVGVEGFPTLANGGRYSADVGDITLPTLGQANVGKLNGYVTNNGAAAANNRVSFEAFQMDSSLKTSTGYPTTGFTVVHNSAGGYYNTGAVPSGSYRIYITDTSTNHKVIIDGITIFRPYERLDFKLEQRCFGYSTQSCTDPAT